MNNAKRVYSNFFIIFLLFLVFNKIIGIQTDPKRRKLKKKKKTNKEIDDLHT